jgi:hypothetical protein
MKWWWRSIEVPSGHESSAWRYELCRRLFSPEAYPAYTELKRHELDRVASILSVGRHPVFISSSRDIPEHEGYAFLPVGTWNLTSSDDSLKRAFIELINAERKARKITTPKRGTGGRGKQPSQPWKWVECLETKRGLGDGRTIYRDAKRKAAELLPLFNKAWIEVQRTRRILAQLGKKDEPVKWRKMRKQKRSSAESRILRTA